MRIRVADKGPSGGKGPKNRCIALDDEGEVCDAATREGKLYCTKHVEQSPYMKALAATITAKETEEASVKEKGAKAVEPDSLTVKEIYNELRIKGPKTLKALARALNIENDMLKGYINHMAQREQVILSKSRRGSTVIGLPGQPRRRRNPVSWLEEGDSYAEPLDKRVGRLCWSDLSSGEISDHLNVPEGFVSEICRGRRTPARNPIGCDCGAEWWDDPHFSSCALMVRRNPDDICGHCGKIRTLNVEGVCLDCRRDFRHPTSPRVPGLGVGSSYPTCESCKQFLKSEDPEPFCRKCADE